MTSPGETRPGRARVRAAWTIALALVAILVLKVFVCDIRHVDSGSMEPTILGSQEGGESVLVLYGRPALERFDIVVLRRDGEAAPLVKRVVGLPQERVQLSSGDLLIDGARLPADAPRPPAVLVFDDRRQAIEPWFDVEGTCERSGAEWTLGSGALKLRRGLKDDYLGPDGVLVPGDQTVNDAIVECEVLLGTKGRAAIDLVEQGDTFTFRLADGEGRIGSVVGPSEVWLGAPIALPADAWCRVRCWNVDNGLGLEVNGQVVRVAYGENRLDPADHLKQGQSFGSRVRIRGEGGVRVRAIRILRDPYWTSRDVHGVASPEDLGPDECFVLGDNSAQSRDSRDWGPVRLDQILGRPVWVVWPPSRIRRLVPRAPLAPGR